MDEEDFYLQYEKSFDAVKCKIKVQVIEKMTGARLPIFRTGAGLLFRKIITADQPVRFPMLTQQVHIHAHVHCFPAVQNVQSLLSRG